MKSKEKLILAAVLKTHGSLESFKEASSNLQSMGVSTALGKRLDKRKPSAPADRSGVLNDVEAIGKKDNNLAFSRFKKLMKEFQQRTKNTK